MRQRAERPEGRRRPRSFEAKPAPVVVLLAAALALLPGERGATGPPVAVDMAGPAGIAQSSLTFGAAVGDVNGDGAPDFFYGRHYQASAQLFVNDRAGHFGEVDPGRFPTTDRHRCAMADVNLDGLVDLLCAHGARHGTGIKSNELWMQGAGLTFSDHAAEAGVLDTFARGRHVVFLDANADGYPDVYLGNESERPDGLPTYNRLLLNRGGRTFVPAPEFGMDGKPGLGAPSAADYDNDGYTDLLLPNVETNLALYRNDGGAGFTDVSAQTGIAGDVGANGILVDLNGDGRRDLVEVFPTALQIRLQQGGAFHQVAFTMPLIGGHQAAAGDVTGDGRADLYIQQDSLTQNTPDLMLLNDGAGTSFSPMTIPETSQGRADGVYTMDYDGNGLQDFLVLNGGGSSNGPVQLIAFFPPGGGPHGSPSSHRPEAGPGRASDGVPVVPTPAGAALTCGPSWKPVIQPQPPLNENLTNALAPVGKADVWAVGHEHSGTNTSLQPMAEHWNGTRWSMVAVPSPGPGDSGLGAATAISSSDVWAAGFTSYGGRTSSNYAPLAEHWNGSSWSPALLPDVQAASASLTGIEATSTSGVWAVGYRKAGLSFQTLALHRDATSWAVVSTPDENDLNNVLTGISAVSPTDVWAVGWFNDGTVPRPLVEHWDGTSWSIVEAGSAGTGAGVLTSVTALSPVDVWAVGYSNETSYLTLTEHWDGNAWQVVPGPATTAGFGALRAVAGVAGNNVWAGGLTFDTAMDAYQALAENWDGRAWAVTPTPSSRFERQFMAIAAGTDTDLWAAGGNNLSLLAEHNCPIALRDSGFVPSTVTVDQGAGVAWSLPAANADPHEVTDGSGMGLFDSGPRQPGSSFVFTFVAASTYSIVDPTGGGTGLVSVPTLVDPPSGSTSTMFTVTWASQTAPAGLAVDVQIKRPGSAVWTAWLHLQRVRGATFAPDAGPGVYRFRAVLRDPSTGAHAGWSPPASITVT